jgi:hypothetical protein
VPNGCQRIATEAAALVDAAVGQPVTENRPERTPRRNPAAKYTGPGGHGPADDLAKFVQTVRVARRCRRIIRFNFAGTLAVDGIGMGLAVGLLNPLFAAFLHVSSELAFILNSARLLPGVPRRR